MHITPLFWAFFFCLGCHLPRTNIHCSVSVNIITWLALTAVTSAGCLFYPVFHVGVFQCESPHGFACESEVESLSHSLYVDDWVRGREWFVWPLPNGERLSNTAGRFSVYFSSGIYTVWRTLKQFAHFLIQICLRPALMRGARRLAIRRNPRAIENVKLRPLAWGQLFVFPRW